MMIIIHTSPKLSRRWSLASDWITCCGRMSAEIYSTGWPISNTPIRNWDISSGLRLQRAEFFTDDRGLLKVFFPLKNSSSSYCFYIMRSTSIRNFQFLRAQENNIQNDPYHFWKMFSSGNKRYKKKAYYRYMEEYN